MEFQVYETTKDIGQVDVTLHLVQLNEEAPEEEPANVLQLARRIGALAAKNGNGAEVNVSCAAPSGKPEFTIRSDGTVTWTRGLSSESKHQLFVFLVGVAKENAREPHPA